MGFLKRSLTWHKFTRQLPARGICECRRCRVELGASFSREGEVDHEHVVLRRLGLRRTQAPQLTRAHARHPHSWSDLVLGPSFIRKGIESHEIYPIPAIR
jgi:hypothetical protein